MRFPTLLLPGTKRPLRERGAALLFAILLEVLLVLLLLFAFGRPPSSKGPHGKRMLGFDVSDGSSDADASKATEQKQQQRRGTQREPAVQKPVTPPPETPPIPPPPTPPTADVLWMTRRDYASSAIRQGPAVDPGTTQGATQGETASASGSGRMPGDSRPSGRAPDGEPLYAAEWYREPTDAELGAYLPHRNPGPGWGMIACRTIANYHVDDCVELGDGPRGSGYAGAVRQAAWQFRVRPPRIGGKPMTGTWVSIRITYGPAGSGE